MIMYVIVIVRMPVGMRVIAVAVSVVKAVLPVIVILNTRRAYGGLAAVGDAAGAVAVRDLVHGEVILPVPQVHHGVGPGDAAALIPLKPEFPARKAEFFQLRAEDAGIDTQIYKGPQSHIAGDAGEAVKVQGFQRRSS
jgi:hypothetical protein